MDQAAARRYIWGALAQTLRTDILAAAYINGDDLTGEIHGVDEFDRRRIKKAAEQVLKTLDKNAKDPAVPVRHGLSR